MEGIFFRLFKLNFVKTIYSKRVFISSIVFFILFLIISCIFLPLQLDTADGLRSANILRLSMFFISIFFFSIYVIMLNGYLFYDQQKLGYLKLEQRNGISSSKIFFSRVLISSIIIILFVTSLNIFPFIFFILKGTTALNFNIILLPFLTLYFFSLVLSFISIFLIIIFKEYIALLVSIFFVIIVIVSPIVNSILIVKNLTPTKYKEVNITNTITQKLKIRNDFLNIIKDDIKIENNFFEIVENNIETLNNLILNSKPISIIASEESKFDFSYDNFFQSNITFAEIDAWGNNAAFDDQLLTGRIYYFEDKKTIFNGTWLGDFIESFINTTYANKDKLDDNFNSNTVGVPYFDNIYGDFENKSVYDFNLFTSKLLEIYESNDLMINIIEFINYIYYNFISLWDSAENTDIDQLFYRVSKRWDSIDKYYELENGYLHLPDPANKNNLDLYEFYSDIPGVSIFLSIFLNLYRSVFYLDIKGVDDSVDLINLYNETNKKIKIANQINIFNHWNSIFNFVVPGGNVLIKYSLKNILIVLPIYYMNVNDDYKKLENEINTEIVDENLNNELKYNFNPALACMVYIILTGSLVYLAYFIFNKKIKD